KLVEEDYGGSSCTAFPEDFPYRLFRLAYPLAEELGSFDRDEVGLALRRYCLREHGLAASWGSEEENAFWWSYSDPLEDFGFLDRPFDCFLEFLFDLCQSSYVCPVHRGHFDVDLSHRGWCNFSVCVHEVLYVDFHFLQDTCGYPLLFEIDL